MKGNKLHKPAVLGFILAVVVAVLAWSEQEGQDSLKDALQIQTVPVGLLRFGELGEILRNLELVTFSANDYSRYRKTEINDEDPHIIPFQRKRQVDHYLYKSNPEGEIRYQSSSVANAVTQKKDWPILSLVVDDKDLNDPETGILVHREKKGKQWERLVQVSYMEDGKILFETHAGIRMHGGERLITREWQPGYKLYFRKKFGLKEIPPGLILPDLQVPLRTLVLQTTEWPPGYPMNNPLSYDIARRIGCNAPLTRLVEVYLNGKSLGMHVSVEHLSRRQYGQRFGHDNYNLYKTRSENVEADTKMYMRKLWVTVTAKERLTREMVATSIDVDNLSRHIFSWVFCATDDFPQGVAVYDNEDPGAKLSWINWDMDHSFYDREGTVNKMDRDNWQQSAFDRVYRDDHLSGRTKLFTRLMRESEEYRSEFINLVVFLLNHRLTPDFLHERVDYYRQMMENFGEPHEQYVAMLKKFMDHRPEFIFKDMQEKFGLSAPFVCRVKVPRGETFAVDGSFYEQDYRGMYFTTTPVHIAVSEDSRPRFRYWLVNGEKFFTTELQLSLQEDTELSLVFEPQAERQAGSASPGGSPLQQSAQKILQPY